MEFRGGVHRTHGTMMEIREASIRPMIEDHVLRLEQVSMGQDYFSQMIFMFCLYIPD